MIKCRFVVTGPFSGKVKREFAQTYDLPFLPRKSDSIKIEGGDYYVEYVEYELPFRVALVGLAE